MHLSSSINLLIFIGVAFLIIAIIINIIKKEPDLSTYMVSIFFIILGLILEYNPDLGMKNKQNLTHKIELTHQDKNIRKHIEKFVDKGIFVELIKNNNGKVLQYGYMQNAEASNTLIIEIEFPKECDLSQMKAIISNFAKLNHFNWSIGHNWISPNKDGVYTCSYYKTDYDIYITYNYFEKFPKKMAIGVTTYSSVKNTR